MSRIAEATEALLIEKGEGATVGEMVARARTSVGSFYARFDDKDAAIRYAEERFWAGLRAEWDRYLDPKAWRGISANAIAARAVRTVVWSQLRNGERLRAFTLHRLQAPGARVVEQTRALDLHVAQRVTALLADRLSPAADPAWHARATRGFLCVISAVRDQVLLGRRRRQRTLVGKASAKLSSRSSSATPDRESLALARETTVVLVRMYLALVGVAAAPMSDAEVIRLCDLNRQLR